MAFVGRWHLYKRDGTSFGDRSEDDLASALGTNAVGPLRPDVSGQDGDQWALVLSCKELQTGVDSTRAEHAKAMEAAHLEPGDIGAVALFSMKTSSRTPNCAEVTETTTCVIQGLKVMEPFRKNRWGASLYEAMICHAVEESQLFFGIGHSPVALAHCRSDFVSAAPYSRIGLHGTMAPYSSSHSRIGLHGTMALELATGDCRRQRAFIAFLVARGWTMGTSLLPPDPQTIGTTYLALSAAQLPAVKFVHSSGWGAVDDQLLMPALVVNKRLKEAQQTLLPGCAITGRQTGLCTFTVRNRPCRELENQLTAQQNWVKDWRLAVAQHFSFPGCDVRLVPIGSYKAVAAKSLDPREQARRTLTTKSPAAARKVVREVPAVAELLYDALRALGMSLDKALAAAQRVCVLHFFCIERSGSATYAWHTDDSSLADLLGLKGTPAQRTRGAYGIRSMVIQLGDGCQTAMCMYGFSPAEYAGRGAGVAFHGSAVHRAVPWTQEVCNAERSPTVWKMSAFWLPETLGYFSENSGFFEQVRDARPSFPLTVAVPNVRASLSHQAKSKRARDGSDVAAQPPALQNAPTDLRRPA